MLLDLDLLVNDVYPFDDKSMQTLINVLQKSEFLDRTRAAPQSLFLQAAISIRLYRKST